MVWKQLLRKNFTSWQKLAEYLSLSTEQCAFILERPEFSLNLPFRLAVKIEKGTLDDPILKQFLPTLEEKDNRSDYFEDPVSDATFRDESKLLRKYPGRVLLVCTSACAMHCRFCFRQNFDYDKSKEFAKELECIERDSSIHEVILSGGDPLSLHNEALRSLLFKISEISHINRIRFHTRFPIGIPERIDADFLSIIEKMRPSIWFIIHCNHPKELDSTVLHHLKLLQERRVVVMNQAVLLKGVNDQVDVLQDLCEKLVDHGILPYYLHQLDKVQGARRFEVPQEEGEKLIQELMERLPGYAVPKYVREIPGKKSKSLIY